MKLRNKLFSCIFLLTILFSQLVNAQTKTYITHTIKQGETLTALAKQYNSTVGDIMRLNGMNSKSILKVGEVVKIPTAKTTIKTSVGTNTKGDSITAETNSKTVTHVAQKGETLYGIAKKYKVYVSNLKTWNKLTSDNIKVGQILIVSNVPASLMKSTVQTNTTSQAAQPSQQDSVSTNNSETIADTTVQTAPTNSSDSDTTSSATTVTAVQTQSQPTIDPSTVGPEGYFKSLFGVGVEGRSLQTISGTSMTFKTASGWTDKKYYILINNVPPGSIVKITSADNKIIYAKVLWSMSNIKENEGLDFRISTAAAAVLGLSDANFPLTVTYYE